MTVIPDIKAVQQLKQYYQLIEEGRASMQKGGGKRKKGGTRHKKLGIKIKEMHNKIKFLEKTRAFADDQDELERDILTNTNEIKIIRDYINKIFEPTTRSIGKVQIDNWNSSKYVNDPDIRSYNGGRRKPKKRRRNKKTKRKRRRNKKTRRKKSRK
tara:strand:+ start:2637 stop:3104 length:468 start_codon:yes stop_codon:yes gene_type:complete